MEALDLKREGPRIVEMYGKGDPRNRDDGDPKLMEHFLIARRLVEAGARCVTLAFSRWDHHGDNFGALRQDRPLLDQGLSALLQDLHDRGLEEDVRVVVLGWIWTHSDDQEGRWTQPLAPGQLRAAGRGRAQAQPGDRLNRPARRRSGQPPGPVRRGSRTLYHAMGIDVNKVTLPDLSGRPQFLVDNGIQPMRELI